MTVGFSSDFLNFMSQSKLTNLQQSHTQNYQIHGTFVLLEDQRNLIKPLSLNKILFLMETILLEAVFEEGISETCRKSRLVHLTSQSLNFYEDDSKKKLQFHFQLSTDNLFQVLYSNPSMSYHKKPHKHEAIGFRLTSFDKVVTQVFHTSSSIIRDFRSILEKRINQQGFKAQYRPLKKIGKGNFGSVYLAERIEDGLRVAVKAFNKQATYSQDKGKESLANQIKMMRNLHHNNIARLISVYESANSVYMVMEALEGGHLMDKFDEEVRFTIPQVKKIMYGLMKGLAHMHAFRIMHRDLKPQNLLFRTKKSLESIVIADFGLAANADAQEHLFVRCGTPGYVAPQVIRITDMTTRTSPICDVFSAGIIFHMLLMDRSVFIGETYDEILWENRNCQFELEGLQYQQLDKNTYSLLTKMLEIIPERRITAQQALKHPFFQDKVLRPISYNRVGFSRPKTLESSVTSKRENTMEPLRPAINYIKNIHSRQLQCILLQQFSNSRVDPLKRISILDIDNSQLVPKIETHKERVTKLK